MDLFFILVLSLYFNLIPQTQASEKSIRSFESIEKIHLKVSRNIEKSMMVSVREALPLAENWINRLNETGMWDDLDYVTQSGVNWGPSAHLGRLRILAALSETVDSPFYHQEKIFNAIRKGLNLFIQNNYKNYNWWFNEIGVPLCVGEILILLKNQFNQNGLQEEYLKISSFFMNRGISIVKTGQNFAWIAQIWIYKGVIEENEQPILDAVHAMENEIKTKQLLGYKKDEGIFPDFSFIQHYWVFYNLGYGLYFSDTLSLFISYLEGTPYQMSAESIQLLLDFLVNGQLSMVRNDHMDYNPTGRGHVRDGSQSALLFSKICSRLLFIESDYTDILQKCVEGIPQKSFSQNRNQFFWNGDYMVHQRDLFLISVKMHSPNLVNADQPSNGEGIRSEHLSDGATTIFQTSNEYENIFPIWDYRKVPGTTALPLPWPNPKTVVNFDYRTIFSWSTNPQSFVGGVSDGLYGFTSMEILKRGIHEKKSYFFNDDGVMVLGSDLSCKENCAGLSTTVEQNWLDGAVIRQSNSTPIEGKILLPFEKVSEKINWVYHHKTLYLIQNAPLSILSNQKQTGDVANISAQMPSEKREGNVFMLTIPRNEKESKTIAYSVFPGVEIEKRNALILKNSFKIIENSEKIQSVESRLKDGTILYQSAFYVPSTLKIENEFIKEVRVSSPLLIQFKTMNQKIDLMVSDPTKKLNSSEIFFTLKNNKILHQTLMFPKLGMAGSSVNVELSEGKNEK